MPFFTPVVNARPSPFHRKTTPGLCWVCNRHIGPDLSCPFCEAPQPFRSTQIVFRLIALTSALAGIAVLLTTARLSPCPSRTPIARLNPQVPFNGVRIEGRLVRKTSSFITRLQDESGIIRIFLDRAVGPYPGAHPNDLPAGQPLALLGSAALDSQGRTVFYGLKWSIPISSNRP